MRLIDVPVKIIPITEAESDRMENLGYGSEPEPVDIMMSVNVKAITAYYRLPTENEVSLFLNNSSSPWRIFMTLEQFEKLLFDN